MTDHFDDPISEFDELEIAAGGGGGTLDPSNEDHCSEDDRGNTEQYIALIEDRVFLRECVSRSVHAKLPFPVHPYETVADLTRQHRDSPPRAVMLSIREGHAEKCFKALNILSESLPRVPVILLAHNDDPALAYTAIRQGVKGYIPFTIAFDIAVAAMRLILAGGTFVPAHFLLQAEPSGIEASAQTLAARAPTSRELAVVRAIQKGMSNKLIAYELNVCESTVKVHIRNIMKKLNARNRTDIAIRAQSAWGSAQLVDRN